MLVCAFGGSTWLAFRSVEGLAGAGAYGILCCLSELVVL